MNNMKTVGLLAFMGALFVLIGSFWGTNGALIALVIAGLMNFAMYFFSDRMALAAARARPIEEGQLPNVRSIVSSLAHRENIPMPKLYVIDSPQPNAFATGRNPKHAAVAVTTGILDLMTHQELEGVLAHELAHVKNRDILISTIAATMAAALAFLARMAFWTGLGGNRRDNNPIGAIVGIVAMIVAPIAAMLIRLAISRAREFQADASGAEITGSPLALASALQKLEMGTSRVPMNVNPAVSQLFIADPLKAFGRRGGGLGSLGKMFATHPPRPERVERLSTRAMGIR